MRPSEYLDALRAKLDLPSDYALQKRLEVSKGAISNYRNNRNHFDEDICRRVAFLLEIHPGIVIVDMHRDKAKSPENRSMWEDVFAGFLTLLPHAKTGWSLALPR